jgi:hypothetical protein
MYLRGKEGRKSDVHRWLDQAQVLCTDKLRSTVEGMEIDDFFFEDEVCVLWIDTTRAKDKTNYECRWWPGGMKGEVFTNEWLQSIDHCHGPVLYGKRCDEDFDGELGIRSGQTDMDYSFVPGDRVLVCHQWSTHIGQHSLAKVSSSHVGIHILSGSHHWEVRWKVPECISQDFRKDRLRRELV